MYVCLQNRVGGPVWASLISVIVRCVGQAPTRVIEQAKVAKVEKDVVGDNGEWVTYE